MYEHIVLSCKRNHETFLYSYSSLMNDFLYRVFIQCWVFSLKLCGFSAEKQVLRGAIGVQRANCPIKRRKWPCVNGTLCRFLCWVNKCMVVSFKNIVERPSSSARRKQKDKQRRRVRPWNYFWCSLTSILHILWLLTLGFLRILELRDANDSGLLQDVCFTNRFGSPDY